MKKRILCLVLTLMLALSLAAVPAAAAPLDAYTDAVKAAIAENGTAYPGYGMLYDLDANGTDELLMLYRSEQSGAPNVVLSVYTLANGVCTPLLDHAVMYQEVGSTTGAVSVVKKNNETLLLPERESSESDAVLHRYTGSAALYTLASGALKEVSRLDYKYDETLSGDGEWTVPEEKFTGSERTGSGTAEISYAQFQAWFNALDRLTLLVARDVNDRGDGLPLELLLGRLEGHIGPFTDVAASEWYADSVEWALLHKITDGMTDTTFGTGSTCTRAQMVTFLWRAHGSPMIKTDGEIQFTDVPKSEYYYDAVRWAVTLGITDGMTDTTFAPDGTVNRAQTVTFLWRDACHPSAAIPNFADVPLTEYYASAVGWAQEVEVTDGVTETTFAPNDPCTRAQIVTFLSRAMCAPGLHASDVTGLDHGKEISFATDSYGKQILFTAVGDVDDFSVVSLMLTATEGLKPDMAVKEVGALHDGDTFLLQTGIPDVAARYGVTYTIGDRTVTLAITDSGRDGSVYLTEL